MKSIPGLILLFLGLCTSFIAEAKVDKLRCMWRNNPATSMVIGWNQTSGSAPEVCYGQFDGGSDTNFYPNCAQPARSVHFKGMNNYFVRLENLHPNTEYFFIIVDSEGTSRRYSFKTTSDNPSDPLSIIAGGDSRNYRNARQRANQMVAKLRPDFVMFGGDMTGGDTDREWKEWMDDWQLTISEKGQITPIVATRGNHEYSNRTIVDLFDVPSNNVYYKLTFGGNLLEVFTLNSLIASGGDQKKWLTAELENSQNSLWRMAQYHFAIRPHTGRKTERNDQLSNWAKLFHKYQMNLVVESDAHVVKTTWPISPSHAAGSEEGFIRNDELGTVYVGEGCWGAPLRRNNDDKNWTRNSGSFNQFKWIFVNSDQLEVRTVKTDNVHQVASVSKYDPFTPPQGIEIWEPSNGSVIIIPSRQLNSANELLAFDSKNSPSQNSQIAIDNPSALAEADGVRLEWAAKNPGKIQNSFLVQKQILGGQFKTLAKVEGAYSSSATFSIMDIGEYNDPGLLGYRLVCAVPGRKSTIKDFSVIRAPESEPLENLEIYSNSLSPDEKSGYLRVKYSLGKKSDVSIRLVSDSDEISASDYQNQREGNYLKSINMTNMPAGNYQLIIKVDEEILHEYVVRK